MSLKSWRVAFYKIASFSYDNICFVCYNVRLTKEPFFNISDLLNKSLTEVKEKCKYYQPKSLIKTYRRFSSRIGRKFLIFLSY